MSLRRNLLGLAGTLMLAASPTAIVMAQDAQAPTTEAPAKPAPEKPSVEDILKRHKKSESQGDGQAPAAPQAAPEQPAQEDAPPKPRPDKPRQEKSQKPAAPSDQPAAGEPDAEQPAVKPRRQKPAAAQDEPAQGTPDAGDANQPAVKPRPEGKQPGKRAPSDAAQPDAPAAAPAPDSQQGETPVQKPQRQKPAAAQDEPAQGTPDAGDANQPAVKPRPEGKQPGKRAPPDAAQPDAPAAAPAPDSQQGETSVQKPQRQKLHKPGQKPGDGGQPGAAPDAPAAAPDPDSQQDGAAPEKPLRQRPPKPGQKPADNAQPGAAPDAGLPGNANQPDDQTGPRGPGNRLDQGKNPGRGKPSANPRDQMQAPNDGAPQDQGQPSPRPTQGTVNPAAEQRGISLLADSTPLERLSDQALRQRLGVYRAILATGNLSPATERGLIQRLNSAREALRGRVSLQEYPGAPQPGQPGRRPQFGRPQFHQGSPQPQDVPAILADRRPSTVLTIDQLNRRILVYRDAANDQRYSPDDRDAFGQYLQADRVELRNRLLSDRGQRNTRLHMDESGGRLRMDLDVAPRGPRSQSVWAAEVDDDQIEEQFAARPLRPLPRRFPRAVFFAQPEMVMEQPFVRQAIPSVELDTIHFGFNESFVREEEIANLDRIGRILERIVAAHPNEVFVIEGNTDAVGDDAYNLVLSKKRAEAVKQALTQYYVISPDNLVTAGLGERYLKIPTPDPEQENRRVTIRRVTSLLQN